MAHLDEAGFVLDEHQISFLAWWIALASARPRFERYEKLYRPTNMLQKERRMRADTGFNWSIFYQIFKLFENGMSDYMPRGPNVVTTRSLCIVCNAKQDLSYFYMWACCPFSTRLVCLSGQLENASLEHKGIALQCSNAKLGFEVPIESRFLHGTMAACLIC